MKPLLTDFIAEAREILDTAMRDFVDLEASPDDDAIVARLFRGIHTLKGTSGLIEDIQPLTSTVHAAEDLLDSIRAGEIACHSAMVDLMLETVDQVMEWIDNLESTEHLDHAAARRGDDLSERLRAYLPDEVEADDDQDDEIVTLPPPWLDAVPEESRLEILKDALRRGEPLLAVTYTPDGGSFFLGDDPFLTVQHIEGARWSAVVPTQPWPEPVTTDFDPYLCVLQFRLLLISTPEAPDEALRYVADQREIVEIRPRDLLALTGPESDSDALPAICRELEAHRRAGDLDGLRETAAAALPLISAGTREGLALQRMVEILCWVDVKQSAALAGWLLDELIDGPEPAAPEPNLEVLLDDAEGAEAVDMAIQILERQAALAALDEGDEAVQAGRRASACTVIASVCAVSGYGDLHDAALRLRAEAPPDSVQQIQRLVEESVLRLHAQDPDAALEDDVPLSPTEGASPRKGEGRGSQGGSRVLKVDQARIDTLMDLVGELVVAKNSMPFLARRAESEYGVRGLAREIMSQHAVINRLAADLQAAVMQVRMVPVSRIFQRFHRLVRDIARRIGKEVLLEIEGEQTEADKHVIEELADPLLHIIRNAIDHGIEAPAARQQAGKPAEGRLKLSAAQIDDRIVIAVTDDGRGINAEAVKRKALERDVITADQAETMSDQAAYQLIFAPGLSTAEAISDLSGRGVGMDVVHNIVTRLGGAVQVHSQPGQGTRIELSLPMSMAVVQILSVQVDRETFGIPFDAIVETVRMPRGEIKLIKDREVIVLRDRLIPVTRLRNLLDLEPHEGEEEAILIVEVDGQEIGLIVDRFHEAVDIILKPLEGIISRFRLYSGTALLGNGNVLLVLNLREVIRCLSR